MAKKRSSFSSSLGFILAAAGSAVGLGNIWRFPYLAAKDGGGLFILIYIILVLTFGFTLLTSEIGIGRKTKQSQLTAYSSLNKSFGWLGYMAQIIPMMILPYYCVIGGWVLKYLIVFLTGDEIAATRDDYFVGAISDPGSAIIFNCIFLFATILVVYFGVNKGIEKMSKILMPALVVLIVGIVIFSLTIHGTDPSGVERSGIDGFLGYISIDFSSLTFKQVVTTVIDAMGQLFYSISVAMGIMISYGSYLNDDADVAGAVGKIEIFDTLIALLAGAMIIPSVLVFMGPEGMEKSGPSLMFVIMPKVLASMGVAGKVVGVIFFLTVLFAAITSSVSLLEAIVAGFIDRFKWKRKKVVVVAGIFTLIMGTIVALGYSIFYIEFPMPNGNTGQILDVLDYISNNLLMPILAIGTCIMIGWVLKPKTIVEEVTKNGEKFGREKLYVVMVKFIVPILLCILFLTSGGIIKL
ncbi:MAG: sodium-dependent transporter [Eubacterium sp.]|nr:sodium-dependent transporter [Eubacterium sp.]